MDCFYFITKTSTSLYIVEAYDTYDEKHVYVNSFRPHLDFK